VNGKGSELLLFLFGHQELLQVPVGFGLWMQTGQVVDRANNKTARILIGPGPSGFKIGCD
jgi:hypothetical protein